MVKKRDPLDRQKQILALLKEHRDLSTNVLAKKLDVSEVTIRHDLEQLEQEEKLIRRQGGATLLRLKTARDFLDQAAHKASREIIAQKALSIVNDGDSLILDSGRTLAAFSKKLHVFKDLTILTKGLDSAIELLDTSVKDLYVIGGRIQKNYAIEGSDDLSYLDSFIFDTLFLGTVAIDELGGIMTTSLSGARVNKKFAGIAKKIVLLCPSYKINRGAVFRVLPLEKLNVFITDQDAPEDFLTILKEKGIDVIIA